MGKYCRFAAPAAAGAMAGLSVKGCIDNVGLARYWRLGAGWLTGIAEKMAGWS